ncbi:MAG TPA: type I phosphomannose isomerase catalytic subunit [Prosthecobacter sp.]
MNWNRLLRFAPVYQTRVWGGRHLETLYGRSLPDPSLPYGESWEICDREEAQSVLLESDGQARGLTLHDLWIHHREEVFGSPLRAHPAPRFPLLMKILDARDDLSIQVHPPAAMAEQLEGEPKTEMWFITQAEPDARLYAGFRAGVTRTGFEAALARGEVAGQMHALEAASGQCLFLPSGRVHAIGAGCVIFEIQQNSDTTYRVFDWNRVGLDGKPRALHISESLISADFEDHEPAYQPVDDTGLLVECPFFQVSQRVLATGESTVLGQEGQHLTVAMVAGQMQCGSSLLKAGDFAIVPAAMAAELRKIRGGSAGCSWLEVALPEG